MDWHQLRLGPLKMDASKIIVMTGEMIGETTVEVVGGMIAAVIAIAAMTVETTEGMIGVNLMKIVETSLHASRLRLPLPAKERGTPLEMTTRLWTRRTWSLPPSRTTSAAFAG